MLSRNSQTSELTFPQVLLFDWHGTLVNTLDAMYRAIEDMLPQLEELGLVGGLAPEETAKTPEDAKLIRYIRIFRQLRPKILAERRVSRTDIFDAIFGLDQEAKAIAHRAYNVCYKAHYGKVSPFQDGITAYLSFLKKQGFKLAIATNRSREFLDNEMLSVNGGGWRDQFDAIVCGDEVEHYKPSPDSILLALAQLGVEPGPRVWYVGDSVTDMITAKNAGVTPIFYNGALWDERWIAQVFPDSERSARAPDAIVDDFDQLLNLLETTAHVSPKDVSEDWQRSRPQRLPPRQPPPERIEPDWHPAVADLEPPRIILFDWHATLVDTLDAMYHAVDDMLPELSELGLDKRLVAAAQYRSPEDGKLVDYVRDYKKLHPKIKIDRKISRTDIFEVLFGADEGAKRIAHMAFNRHYRNHFGTVLPFEPEVKNMLLGLRQLKLHVGVITNRDREFFVHELAAVEGSGWYELFDTAVCGDDTPRRKPYPDQLLKALTNMGTSAGCNVWYVGDSTTDTIAAKRAAVTSVFFNGAQWDQPWLNKIFPGTEQHPYQPDVVVNDFSELWALVLACLEKK
ncbi:MAG: HAD family hydrolase [Pseudomonadales bacterium]